MGYYTNFEIKIKQGKVDIQSLQDTIDEISEYGFDNDGEEIWSNDEIKWYDYEEDMKKVSTLFPDIVIEVDGTGEESGDIWKTFWKNGKNHKSKRVVTMEDYDESKLS